MNGALIFSVKSADDGGAKHTLSDDIVLIRDVVLQFFFFLIGFLSHLKNGLLSF